MPPKAESLRGGQSGKGPLERNPKYVFLRRIRFTVAREIKAIQPQINKWPEHHAPATLNSTEFSCPYWNPYWGVLLAVVCGSDFVASKALACASFFSWAGVLPFL